MAHSLFQPTPAPGRDVPAPAQPQPAQQAPAPQEGGAPPPGGLFGGGSTILLFLLPLLLIFFMTRSQNKKQKELESSLKAGDRVITNAGIRGKIIDVGERYIKVEIAPGVNVEMIRSAIQGQENPDTKSPDAKAKELGAKDKPQEKKA